MNIPYNNKTVLYSAHCLGRKVLCKTHTTIYEASHNYWHGTTGQTWNAHAKDKQPQSTMSQPHLCTLRTFKKIFTAP